MDIYVKPFDYNPSDKYVDLLIEYYGRDDVSSTRAYRYKKKKLSLLFNADNARGWWSSIPSEQGKDKYVIVENVHLSESLMTLLFSESEMPIKTATLYLKR